MSHCCSCTISRRLVNNISDSNHLPFLWMWSCWVACVANGAPSPPPHMLVLSQKWLLCGCRQMFGNFPVVSQTYRHSQQAFSSAHYLFSPPFAHRGTTSPRLRLRENPNLQRLFKRVQNLTLDWFSTGVLLFEVAALKCGEVSRQSQEERLI